MFNCIGGTKFRKLAASGLKVILDLIYPPGLYCMICGNLIDSSRPYELCDFCREHVNWRFNEDTLIKGVRCISCCGYGMYERRLIFRLKYNRKEYTAGVIGEIVADRIKVSDFEFDIIVPVPMEKTKEKRRGFNHAYLIAKEAGRHLEKPVLKDGLVRIKKTKAMRGLGPYERKANIAGAFALGRNAQIIRGKRVLLLDDISTTFATGEECIKVLRSANPKEICFVAFAARNF
ncbi:MAG: hypothetical protein MR269_03280 [Clostridiales bacterium]|nr:hypothetical protein [Clostridiales bacterium]